MVLPLLALPAPAFAERGGPRGHHRAAGEIIAVDTPASTFEMRTRRGEDLTVFVTEDTVFRSIDGEIENLEDVEVGMKAFVAGEPVEGGISARIVGAAHPDQLEGLKRVGGEVVQVNRGRGDFTLENRAGEEVLLTVSDETRFHSPQGDVAGLEDLERGMHAVAVYREADGLNLALRVGVRAGAHRPGWPRADVRAAGRITSIGDETVTIEARNGRMVTMAITDRTVVRARGGGEPQEGDFAIALGQHDAGGEVRALLVVAFPGRGPADGVRPQSERQGFGGAGFDWGR